MHKLTLSFAAALAVLFSVSLPAADNPPKLAPARAVVSDPPASPFAAGQWNVSPFASYRAHEIGKFDGKLGGGLAVGYFLADNIAVEVETLSEHIDDSHWADAFTEAGVNFKGYLPIGATGLAPYGLLGYTRNLQQDENRMNAGAGIEARLGKLGKVRPYLFADGRWTHNFSQLGQALFRFGGGVSF